MMLLADDAEKAERSGPGMVLGEPLWRTQVSDNEPVLFMAPRCSVWATENGVDELEPDSVGEQLTLARGLKIPLKKERHGSQRII